MTRPVDDAEKRRRGTARPSRKVVTLFADHAARPDPVDLAAPPHLSRAAKRIWRDKVERYRARGQKVDGFQDALGVYCEAEATLNLATRRGVATPALVAAWRRFAGEFFDTPRTQQAAPSGRTGANPYSTNGQSPRRGDDHHDG